MRKASTIAWRVVAISGQSVAIVRQRRSVLERRSNGLRVRLAQFVALPEIRLRRLQCCLHAAWKRRAQPCTACPGRRMAFGRIETGPFGLRFAHARRNGIRMQAAADELLDRFAKLLAALVVAPMLPWLTRRSAALLGEASRHRPRYGFAGVLASECELGMRCMRARCAAGFHRAFEIADQLLDAFDAVAFPGFFLLLARVGRIQRGREAGLRKQGFDDGQVRLG